MDEWKYARRSEPFQILGSTQTKDGTSIKELKIRLAQAHSALTRLAMLWKNNAISFATKIKLYKSLVLSILVYGCRRDALCKIILQETVDGSRRTGRPRKSWKDNIKQWMDTIVDVVIVAHHGWQRSMGSHRSRCICRSTPNES